MREALSPRLAESQKGSRGGPKSGAAEGLRLIVRVRLCDRLAVVLRSDIISQPSKLPSTFNHKNGHQVGSTV